MSTVRLAECSILLERHFIVCNPLQSFFHSLWQKLWWILDSVCFGLSSAVLHVGSYKLSTLLCFGNIPLWLCIIDTECNCILISLHCYHSNIVMPSLIKCVPDWIGRHIRVPVFNFEQKFNRDLGNAADGLKCVWLNIFCVKDLGKICQEVCGFPWNLNVPTGNCSIVMLFINFIDYTSSESLWFLHYLTLDEHFRFLAHHTHFKSWSRSYMFFLLTIIYPETGDDDIMLAGHSGDINF